MQDLFTPLPDADPRQGCDQRRAGGVFFTPPAVVRYIVHHTLGTLLDAHRDNRPLRILEPSCGQGVFLAEAFCYLRERLVQAGSQPGSTPAAGDCGPLVSVDRQRHLLLNSCFGLDIEPAFVAATQTRLARQVSGAKAAEIQALQQALQANIRRGDALLGPDFVAWHPASLPADADRGQQSPPQTCDLARVGSDGDGPFAAASFDAVIGNPPYVNIRRLTTSRGAAVKRYLRTHYQCARGAFDLYVLFLELAFRVLRPGGRCGFIVPNKLAGLAYAATCRDLLVERTTIERIVDLSQWRVFPEAGVYPYIVIWKKQEPPLGHRIAVFPATSEAELATESLRREVPQTSLATAAGWQLHGTLDVESRVATRPLGTLARLHSGTTGFQAAAVADALGSEPPGAPATDSREYFRFIVSGNIDRYLVRWGQARFMRRRFERPVLPSCSNKLTDAKRQLYQGSKIVIAGMTRRIEAAWDPGGLALGVQVFAAAKLQEDRRYLLGLLNSRLFSFLFRIRFRAKQLAGGFLSINKAQLDQLPIRVVQSDDDQAMRLRQQIMQCVESLERLTAGVAAQAVAHPAPWPRSICELDQQIDAGVYQLYRLTADEIARIEANVPQ
jgi:SAM-dependent methyltransferase